MRKIAMAAVSAVALGTVMTPVSAEDMIHAGDVAIMSAYARASLGASPNSAAYMVLETAGTEPDRLVGGSTPVADEVQLHTHMMEDGVAKMRQVDAIEVAPGEPTVLEPGGLHVMLMGLSEPLEDGATLPLTLEFEKAGAVEFEVPIRTISVAN